MQHRRLWLYSLLALGALLAASLYSQYRPAAAPVPAAGMPTGTSFLVVLGVGDKAATAWDGSVALTGGSITGIRGWRFAGKDVTDSKSTWQVSTRLSSGINTVMMENGIIITANLTDPAAAFNLTTAQGNFSFAASDINYGSMKQFLKGRAYVDRVPGTMQLTTSIEEEDFPVSAVSGDTVYVSYVQFVHGDRSGENVTLKAAPSNFDWLGRPAGGDQVYLMQYSKSNRTWTTPVAVSDPGQDIMRTAVAVDGQGRVWVFWSANQDGNFDLYARYLAQGKWSSLQRLTWDPGTDLNPVATTDVTGRIWIAWQGYRNGNLEILAAAQQDTSFSAETIVSFSPASNWDPAIAAAPNGDVAVSWDTYDKSDYDVYFRRLRFGQDIQMDDPVPVAASPNFEARSSIVFDAQNRLWVAYEVSSSEWGKNFGAYASQGIGLYQGHNIAIACFQGNDRFTTAADVTAALLGPSAGAMFPRRFGPGAPAVWPNPDAAGNRQPNGGTPQPGMPLNTSPRLTIDAAGKVYLAYRALNGNGTTSMGSIWHEEIVYFDGAAWSAPIIVPNTDALLDNRPAVVALSPTDLMLVASTDHRQQPLALAGQSAINSDLYAAEVLLTQQSTQALNLTPAPSDVIAPPESQNQAESDQVTAMRSARLNVGGNNLQLVRGEFHRHSEMSFDGGHDGSLADQYRYLIDAANMDWAGCCDHDNGTMREYSWWMIQKYTDAYRLDGRYMPMFAYERSVNYPEGHRNVLFASRGIRPLPRLPVTAANSAPTPAPDTQMLYQYLRQFNGLTSPHTTGTDMGTDWRNNDPAREPVVEIYQGDRQNYEMPGAPRTNTAGDSIGGWRPAGFVSLALDMGYRLGFQASSDHISTHMSYCNVWVKDNTRQGILEALAARRTYGSTENILADVRSGDHFMGEEFSTSNPPSIEVKLWGMQPFANVYIIKDGRYVYSTQPNTVAVDLTWRDNAAVKGQTSYYYVRGEQSDGELVWVSPMWIKYQ
jgi:hypothetical protein